MQQQHFHQIVGLRDYIAKNGETKKKDTFYEKNWNAVSLSDIFKKLPDFLAKIPTDEQFNIYFTVAECAGRREFRRQRYVPFDIDDIEVSRARETVEVALKTLGLQWQKTLSLFSGNGVQFFVELKDPFEDLSHFDNERVFYKACCEKIDKALKEANLPGETDPSVWSAARLMRMPGTFNVKPDKPKRMAEILQDTSVPVDFVLQEASGIPKLTKEEVLAKWPPPDTEAVLAGCENLKTMLSEPEKVAEPLWYANASIIGHLGGNPAEGRRIWHDYSSKYKKYDAKEADRKLEQAMAASGPRTCANMAQLPGAKCDTCPHFKKVRSPIMIVGPNYIRTKEQGFHSMETGADGKAKIGKPNYSDLLKFFEQQHPYVVNSESGQVYTFQSSHYVPMSTIEIRAFAERHFLTCNTNKAAEFHQKILRNNPVKAKWFSETTDGKMNFLNGVLDVQTMKFTQGHSKEQGFLFTLPYNYDHTEKAPRFERYLDEVTEGDKDLQKMLLEFGGYCLSNDGYWEHKALLLTGSGANGKSVFLDILKNVAEKAYSAVSMRNLQDVQHLAILEGRLFNVSEEGSHNAFRETDVFKALTAGGEITVKTVYQKPYQIQNRAKLVFSCNELPPSSDGAHGFYRRFAIVPFNVTFDRSTRDNTLTQKLKGERAGILNMMLEAYSEMKARGYLHIATKSESALGNYKKDNDPIAEWTEDNIDIGPISEDVAEKNDDIYSKYVTDCDASNARPLDRRLFFKQLYRRIPNAEERMSRKNSYRFIRGVRLVKKDELAF